MCVEKNCVYDTNRLYFTFYRKSVLFFQKFSSLYSAKRWCLYLFSLATSVLFSVWGKFDSYCVMVLLWPFVCVMVLLTSTAGAVLFRSECPSAVLCAVAAVTELETIQFPVSLFVHPLIVSAKSSIWRSSNWISTQAPQTKAVKTNWEINSGFVPSKCQAFREVV